MENAAALDLSRWIRPGDRVCWGQATAEPLTLTRALVAQADRLGHLRLFVGIGASDTLAAAPAAGLEVLSYCGAGTHRALAEAGRLEILPVHYSALPTLIAQGTLRIDVVLLQVSAPDADGLYSLGLANDYLVPCIQAARVVIAEVNPEVPFTFGSRLLAAEDFDLLVEAGHPPLESATPRRSVTDAEIARRVAGLVEDGATLQIGIGAIPDAVLAALHGHRDLGLHTGAASDGVALLAQQGVLTNARKSIDRGVGVAGLLMGGATLRRWANRNPALHLRGCEYTHAADVLARIDRFVAINSAIEVDLTGQVNAEVANGVYVGAVGGAVDFLRAAARSRGGVPIVALPSMAGSRSRIVATLSGPVSTARSDAGIVVTEHGSADLRGQPLSARVRRMIEIAAPEQREGLERQARELLARQGAPL
ncbi:acetyl-CoA hydrolase/transferase C-terminal domain-containing protein [Ramlibacter tataouinensis]|uniref:acetyl-CoA hydrolase/transferase family protein n=1 Tax=Ramlibacter tataouinensis TaxID=94132 RepID=UPI0022F3D67C|nr:acetyl-CoA hydrolase/transferase C-terminal domain-containing protein [Ramlibacter tataouinensis]WBY03947.1 acetyl-CoA hydrolase/transferase C-terminal domain-containing protein [Ramlibacter tataouinensis]